MRRLIHAVLLIFMATTTLSGCQTQPTGLTAEQIAMLQRAGFKQTDDGWELNMSAKLLFASDSEQLTPETKGKITDLTQQLLQIGIQHAHLDGHTDNTGLSAYNDQLSLRRANSVAQVMTETGMAPAQISVSGRGQSKPVYDNNTAQGRSENRRVTIIIDAGH